MPDFFDKVREQFSAGLTKVTTKSHVAVETTRLGVQIRRIAKEKEEALLRLGTQVYQELSRHGQMNLEAVQEEVKRIQALDQAIAGLQREIDSLEALDAATPWSTGEAEKPITICTCGAPLTEGSRFCGNCGTNAQEIIAKAKAEQLARAEAAKREAATLCPRCGTEVSSAAKFCRSCGAALAGRPDAVVESQSGSRCLHCGGEVSPAARFCRSCGKPVARETLSIRIQENETVEARTTDTEEERSAEALPDAPSLSNGPQRSPANSFSPW